MLKPLHVAGIFLLASLAGAATIVTTRGPAKVFPNPIRRVFEQPLFVLDKGEVVEVLEWQKPLTKIRNRKGRVGYVDIALLDSLKRPPILRLMIDSSDAAPSKPVLAPAKAALPKDTTGKGTASVSPSKPAQEVKKAEDPKPNTEKPVDFRGDSAHIQPRSNADSIKH